MPTVSEFDGIKIAIYPEYAGKHNTPHFHVYYGSHRAIFSIVTMEILISTKNFPVNIEGKIRDWATKHRKQLKKNWYRGQYSKPLTKI